VIEYGMFNETGCMETFPSAQRAYAAAARYGDLVTVDELCGEHDRQPADGCELCD
jgi:hypothetical protein